MADTKEPRERRSVSFSISESYHPILAQDINTAGHLFGGRLMSWMDETAGVAAMRHSGLPVTTAAVDNIQFLKAVGVGDVIVIMSRVTYVGNTSIEVRVDVYKDEIKSGNRYVINRAYFTEVCIDEEGKPARVPYDIVPETLAETAEYEGAKKRIEIRHMRRKEGF